MMKIKLKNRLEVLMKDSGINTFEEMARRLSNNQGARITRTALSRKFRDADVTLSLSMIEAICNELQCLPGDLFETDVSDASPDFLEELQSRLQPFRYGVIRMQKTRTSVDDDGISAGDLGDVKGTASTAKPKAKAPATAGAEKHDQESLEGPAVTHLHVGKLKQT